MLAIKKEYVVSNNNKKKAVLVDIATFNKMEELLENYGLARYMNEVKEEKYVFEPGQKALYRYE
jgi:PHD/YefM family antitoxin component YafN of YafNO toxin-antitoxin module